jgi:NAD(P)-dependent dehydrogenase (short-subunit alcohol dehydrogenase family)
MVLDLRSGAGAGRGVTQKLFQEARAKFRPRFFQLASSKICQGEVDALKGADCAYHGGFRLSEAGVDSKPGFGVRVKTIAIDLTLATGSKFMVDQLQHEGVAVDVLVNNAGFGSFGEFAPMPEDDIVLVMLGTT